MKIVGLEPFQEELVHSAVAIKKKKRIIPENQVFGL